MTNFSQIQMGVKKFKTPDAKSRNHNLMLPSLTDPNVMSKSNSQNLKKL